MNIQDMEYSDKGFDLTERFEGCRLMAYPDPGTGEKPWTIGYGHTRGVTSDMICTKEQAVAWLHEDIESAENDVRKYVKVPISQGQFDALVDFVFNLGGTLFSTSTLLKKLNNRDYKGADSEFSKWVLSNGKRMKGLEDRRIAEANAFDDGDPKFA